ncbi:MAG: multicopper oxidase domain-containing protein [Ilumatobacteraceae bacterium]
MNKDDRSLLNWFALFAGLAALVVAILGVRDNGSESAADSSASGAKPTITVTMGDLYFTPTQFTIPPQGAVFHLVNEGSAIHNLAIRELDLTSPDVPGNQMTDWEVGPIDEGSYTIYCPQPGHEAAGMVGTLTVSSSATSGGSPTDTSMGGQSAMGAIDWSAMDAAMLGRAQLYPAATQGEGGGAWREPDQILDDGTKVFILEAKVVDWEVEPGKVVKAWTYNGVVPAPTIQVYSGDKVRIILKNELPETTSLHLHGIQVPNVMDGVDPYTESPTPPGGEHVYEFVAKGPAVGIYHSHHDAQQQIPDGMFGAFLIDDIPVPQKLIDKGYPEKPTKVVNMVLNDAGVIGLSLNGKSFPATTPYTIRVGEAMMVNYLNEGLTAHPMHLHQPMGWVVAKDGVPLDEPWPTDTVNVAPGERYTVLYMGTEPGVWAWHCHILTHAETPEGMRYMVTALIVER